MPGLAPRSREPWEKGPAVPKVGHPARPVPSRQAIWEGNGQSIQVAERVGPLEVMAVLEKLPQGGW